MSELALLLLLPLLVAKRVKGEVNVEAEDRPIALRLGYDIADVPVAVFELGVDEVLRRLSEDW